MSVDRHYSTLAPDSIGESAAREQRPWSVPPWGPAGHGSPENVHGRPAQQAQARTAFAGATRVVPHRHRHSTTGTPSPRQMPLIALGIFATTQHPPRPLREQGEVGAHASRDRDGYAGPDRSWGPSVFTNSVRRRVPMTMREIPERSTPNRLAMLPWLSPASARLRMSST